MNDDLFHPKLKPKNSQKKNVFLYIIWIYRNDF